MTTDYVEGATLAELARGGPLPQPEAIRILQAVLYGLEEAHALGIVHRGIAAEHVIVAAEGAVKLGGFDLAKPATDADLTKVGAVVGDPRYVSRTGPGTSRVGRSRGFVFGRRGPVPGADGRDALEGPSDIDVLTAQIGVEPQPPRAMNPAISPDLEAIVLKALRKKPEERFASARVPRGAGNGRAGRRAAAGRGGHAWAAFLSNAAGDRRGADCRRRDGLDGAPMRSRG